MIRKFFTTSFAVFLMATGMKAQGLAIEGAVFERKDGKAVDYVPFATVSYYNPEDTSKLEFCTLSNRYGHYRINDLRNGRYKVKIEAPGFKTKWQAIMFTDVRMLAEGNNNQVYAQIAMERIEQEEIVPIVYPIKDLMQSDDETLADLISRLKRQLSRPDESNTKTYRILFGGKEISGENYELIAQVPFVELADGVGDKDLSKSYFELYDFSGKYRTIVAGVLNIVINNQTLYQDPKKIFNYEETTDFFIKE